MGLLRGVGGGAFVGAKLLPRIFGKAAKDWPRRCNGREPALRDSGRGGGSGSDEQERIGD